MDDHERVSVGLGAQLQIILASRVVASEPSEPTRMRLR